MRYVYLLFDAVVLMMVVGLLFARRDLTRLALRAGLVGGVVGPFSELLYFRDYWRPPALFGVARISVEDFLFGFGITALSAILYAVIFRQEFAKTSLPARHRLYVVFFLVDALALVLLTVFFGASSIVVSTSLFAATGLILCAIRRDLWWPGICSAVMTTIIFLVVYVVLFDVAFPQFWERYWLLAHSRLGVTILGHVPVTEMIWYFSWVLLASVSYPFVKGVRFRARQG